MPAQVAKERRRAARKRVRLKIRFWNDEIDVHGFTVDISATGLFIETHKTTKVGTRLHLEVITPQGPLYAECSVARVHKVPRTAALVATSGMGVRLIEWTQLFGLEDVPDDSGLHLDVSSPESMESLAGELAAGGIYVRSTKSPELGEVVTLNISLPKPHGEIQRLAKIVHVADDGVGLQLDGSDGLRRMLFALGKKRGDAPSRMVGVMDADEPSVESSSLDDSVGCDSPSEADDNLDLSAAVLEVQLPEQPPPFADEDDLILDLRELGALRRVLDSDIRHGGAFVATAFHAQHMQRVVLRIDLPPPHGTLEVLGVVVHVATNPPGLGLQLEEGEAIAEQLREILRQVE